MLEKKKQGFTIIEVVIVLVIGAIIMLMVFLVVPYLQRTQRDSRRQNDARRFLTAAEQYATNMNGAGPQDATATDVIVSQYVLGLAPGTVLTTANNTFKSPGGNAYSTNNLDAIASGAAASNSVTSTNEMIVRYNARCTTTGQPAIVTGTGNNQIAILIFQENGGSFCIQN